MHGGDVVLLGTFERSPGCLKKSTLPGERSTRGAFLHRADAMMCCIG
jgi:hypothetical protein